ncbi:hypothetical protein TSUD_412740 [Trifolium subterraneum]|uniref:Ubiquitin-like protease family profile domain-containing protein n=1 Tax=Trifolium subterraneum TaxID=3900 RepID=A0A2Z6P4G1_TRISU|nr:hypothetical protein TSUD_412740 [Trifolium subterraneum]
MHVIPNATIKKYNKSEDVKDNDMVSSDMELSVIRNHRLSQLEEEDDADFYLNYHPPGPVGCEGVAHDFHIPIWMPMTFRPIEAIDLSNFCAYIAAYIFKPDPKDLFGDEVLIQSTTNVVGDRKALKLLMPRCHLDEKIINLVVARQNWLMSTIGKTRSIWYMPTDFARYALEEHKDADHVRELYQVDYMTARPVVSRMFIPMTDQGNHWYLLVVDFIRRTLIWLDSLNCPAIFLEEILMHESFSEDLTPFCPERIISNFAVHQPKYIDQQRSESNDSGVWVSKWMIECSYRIDWPNVRANTASRMRLAINLVKSGNNVLKEDVLAKADQNWKDVAKKVDPLSFLTN